MSTNNMCLIMTPFTIITIYTLKIYIMQMYPNCDTEGWLIVPTSSKAFLQAGQTNPIISLISLKIYPWHDLNAIYLEDLEGQDAVYY